MKKKIVLNLLVIVIVIAATAFVTWAYFSGNQQKKATVTTGSIEINATYGFDMAFELLMPNKPQTNEFHLQNVGSATADFFFQLVGDDTNDPEPPDYMNFCKSGPLGPAALSIAVDEIDCITKAFVATAYSDSICALYPGTAGYSVMPKLADDVPAAQTRCFEATITLNAAAGQEYEGKANTDIVNLIAVEMDGPEPVPATGAEYNEYSAWPLGDPNYP